MSNPNDRNPNDPTETQVTGAIDFAERTSVEQVEEGHDLAPKFDGDGLIACVTTDAKSGEVLMQVSCSGNNVLLSVASKTYSKARERGLAGLTRVSVTPLQVFEAAPIGNATHAPLRRCVRSE